MKDNLKDIGILGRRHYDYLKANKPTVINVMRMNGTLNSYLKSVNAEAEDMFSQLVKQMAKAEGVTEQLKVNNQMEWVGQMNNIRQRATEIINKEIIYVFSLTADILISVPNLSTTEPISELSNEIVTCFNSPPYIRNAVFVNSEISKSIGFSLASPFNMVGTSAIRSIRKVVIRLCLSLYPTV